MGEVMACQANMPALLDSYAQQGRVFLTNAAQNLIQFGRVLVEAKPLVPHGQFEGWVKDNFGMSKSTAEGYMAVYRRFGNSEQFAAVQYSKLREMLALPAGYEEQFAQENNLDEMTSRTVKDAVRAAVDKVRAEAQDAMNRERAARIAAEKLAEDAKNHPGSFAMELKQVRESADTYRAEIERMAEANRGLLTERNALAVRLATAQRDLDEANDMLAESQQEYNRMQQEMLNARSVIAKGDAERRISEEMTSADFAGAVRSFIGYVAQIPLMWSTFAIMDDDEKARYDEQLRTVEDWAKRARAAISVVMSEVIVDD